MKVTTARIRKLKGERPIVALTAYDFPTAVFADEAGIDLILVGDSVGTTLLGYSSTIPVTMDQMLHHARAVTRALPEALVVVDLPFAEAAMPRERVLENCRSFLQIGADAVKIEGGSDLAGLRSYLIDAGIPVMGHIGLLPQRYQVEGGYRKYGMVPEEAEVLLEDARSVENSGCFACIAEMMDADVCSTISDQLSIPVIGIGSGGGCDGQILVSPDLLGLNTDKAPSFVKVYAELGAQIRQAFEMYKEDVISGNFPK